MNKFNFIFKKSFWKNVLAVVVVAILCAGIIGGGIALGKYIKDKKTTVTTIWERGAIAATDGKVNSDKNSIHTKELFECRGLEIEPDLDSSVTYAIAFYDSDKNFLEKTEYLSGKFYSSDVPFFAQFARVEVNAGIQDGEKVEIGLLKIMSYSKQVKIRVDKNQRTLKARLDGIEQENVLTMRGAGWIDYETHDFSSYATAFYFSDEVDVSSFDIAIIKVKTTTLSNKVRASNGTVVEVFRILDLSTNGVMPALKDYSVITIDEDYSYVLVNVKNVSTIALRVDEASSEVVELYPMLRNFCGSPLRGAPCLPFRSCLWTRLLREEYHTSF